MSKGEEIDAAPYIVDLIETSIKIYEKLSTERPELKKHMGDLAYREQLQKATISMPRQNGHTRAAIEILKRYPTSVLIARNYEHERRLHRENPELTDQIMSITAAASGNRGTTALHTICRLTGGIKCVLIDGASITDQQYDSIFLRFSPNLVVYLGDFERTQ
jgi:hypothetical protein